MHSCQFIGQLSSHVNLQFNITSIGENDITSVDLTLYYDIIEFEIIRDVK